MRSLYGLKLGVLIFGEYRDAGLLFKFGTSKLIQEIRDKIIWTFGDVRSLKWGWSFELRFKRICCEITVYRSEGQSLEFR
jgi:hypothetical protein